MKKNIKRIITVLMVMTLTFAFSMNAFATTTGDILNKVNGIGMANGGSGSYTSTTTTGCYKLTAQGTSDNKSLKVTISVKYGSSIVPFLTREVTLNGNTCTLITYDSNDGLPAGKYTVTVTPESSGVGYEVSTMFYYK